MRHIYNRAKLLNRSAAHLALGVFQRRLASSTYALLRSLERRLEKLDGVIADVHGWANHLPKLAKRGGTAARG